MRRLHKISISSHLSVPIDIQLGVSVLAIARQVLADGHSLLDQHVEILGDLRCKTYKALYQL